MSVSTESINPKDPPALGDHSSRSAVVPESSSESQDMGNRLPKASVSPAAGVSRETVGGSLAAAVAESATRHSVNGSIRLVMGVYSSSV